MTGNRGTTTLKAKKRSQNPMRDFDHLPPELRCWLANAVLPWRAGSVRKAFNSAYARTGDTRLALEELDRLQQKLIQRDAQKVWGPEFPGVNITGAGESASNTRIGPQSAP